MIDSRDVVVEAMKMAELVIMAVQHRMLFAIANGRSAHYNPEEFMRPSCNEIDGSWEDAHDNALDNTIVHENNDQTGVYGEDGQ